MTLQPTGNGALGALVEGARIEGNEIIMEAGGENVLMDIPVKHSGYTHMALEITDLESVKSQLESKDIAITGGPITLPDGATLIFVRDPDGNVIEFHKPGKS